MAAVWGNTNKTSENTLADSKSVKSSFSLRLTYGQVLWSTMTLAPMASATV